MADASTTNLSSKEEANSRAARRSQSSASNKKGASSDRSLLEMTPDCNVVEENLHHRQVPLNCDNPPTTDLVGAVHSAAAADEEGRWKDDQQETSSMPEQEENENDRSPARVYKNIHIPDWLQKLSDNWLTVRKFCGYVVSRDDVQFVIIAMVSINALMMGLATYPFVREDIKTADAFAMTDLVFLCVFTVELSLQFIYHGWRLILDGWLAFDFFVIITSWISTVGEGSTGAFQVFRSFRIFRALRLITRAKTLKNLVTALFGVVPRMFAIAMLLGLITYIFGVMLTVLWNPPPDAALTPEVEFQAIYFGSMFFTLFTLFQICTLDGWAPIARQITASYWYGWLPIVVYVIITGFVVVNLIIAVVCDAISALRDVDKAKLHGYAVEEEQDQGASTSEESIEPVKTLHEHLSTRLDSLEAHVEKLSRTQDEILHTLHLITQAMQRQQRSFRVIVPNE